MFKKITFLCCSLAFLASCENSKKKTFDLVITNASIVDVTSDSIIPQQFIGITNDTIHFVGGMDERESYNSIRTVDANGGYVMPGLWDMHVHFRGGDTLIEENKNQLPLFLAFGVTTVRDAGGDITPSVLEWRKEIAAKNLTGPTIFTPGPKLDGPDPAWPGSLPVEDSADVEKALDSLETLNADYVKIYDGSLTADAFYSIIKAAGRRGLKTTGHMPMSADFRKAIDYGLDGSEHMYYLLKACSPLADSLTKLNLGYGMMGAIVDSYDPELASEVFEQMREKQVYLTPTLHIGQTLAEVLDVDHSNDSILEYIGEGIQETYQGRIEGAKRSRARGSDMRSKMKQLNLDMIEPMYDAGVNMVAGSDCGPYNSFVYPGHSLHGELQKLVQAGLSPQEALSTSIHNGPKFFGVEEFYGEVAQGMVGDLIILSSNPLEDIDFAGNIKTVIKQGKVHDSEAIGEMLRDLEE